MAMPTSPTAGVLPRGAILGLHGAIALEFMNQTNLQVRCAVPQVCDKNWEGPEGVLGWDM